MIRRLLVVVAVLLGVCGSSASTTLPLAAVPSDLIPDTLPNGADSPFTLTEYKEAARRIDKAGDKSMIGHGQVFEVRRGTTLVGALQVATLRPKVDVGSAKQRAKLASLVVSGAVQTITVNGIEVVASQSADKIVFLWFGDQLFEVFQIKGEGLKPEQMLKDILAFQKPSGRLRIRNARS